MYGADGLGAEGTLDNNFRLRKRRACATYGNRAAKWTAANSSETLYFNTMWTWHTDTGLRDGQYSKHIYLGETRVVTKQTSKLEASYGQSDEWHHQYYYHPDHLGSAQLITDYEGNEYQRIEYMPYEELWVERKTEKEEGLCYLPYKFTAKEQDEETGLYYYGARYLDAKYSRWLSADPAVREYIPMAPVDDEAKKHNQRLPGQGGIFNIVNSQLYHYAGNNPVKYTDPDGKVINTSNLNDTQLKIYNKARNELMKTQRGKEIIEKLEGAPVEFTIQMSDKLNNKYDPNNKTVTWDPTEFLLFAEGDVLDPISLLGHELGHALQDLEARLPLEPTEKQRQEYENENVIQNEIPIATERKNHIRNKGYDKEVAVKQRYRLKLFRD